MSKHIPVIDSKGKYYGRLFVLNIVYKLPSRKAYAKCSCACDKHIPKEERKIVIISLRSLRSGNTKSCGCLIADVLKKIKTTHGETKNRSHSVEYRLHKIYYAPLLQQKL